MVMVGRWWGRGDGVVRGWAGVVRVAWECEECPGVGWDGGWGDGGGGGDGNVCGWVVRGKMMAGEARGRMNG